MTKLPLKGFPSGYHLIGDTGFNMNWEVKEGHKQSVAVYNIVKNNYIFNLIKKNYILTLLCLDLNS